MISDMGITTDNIRIANESDYEQIAKISIEGWQHAYKGIFPDSVLNNLQWQPRVDGRRKHFDRDTMACFVYVIDENVVAFCDVGVARKVDGATSISTGYGEIYAIYVLPSYQRQGIGKILFNRALEYVNERGWGNVVIWTLVENKSSHLFYANCGCKPNPWKKYFTVEGEQYPEVAFVKEISK